MTKSRAIRHVSCITAFVIAVLGSSVANADAPTPAQALLLKPIQGGIEYAQPNADEIKQATIKAEKEGASTAWIVRGGNGETLRRFADSNNDNVVDQWCYYLDGLEVYRDIDANFNGKADQYRWLHTAGTRWGTDSNEDGRVDSWKMISPHEVAEELVTALKTRDSGRFNLLVLTPSELGQLGMGKVRAESVAASIRSATEGFSKLASEQQVVTSQSRYLDFGSARPAMIPAGTEGSTKDLIAYDNASALVQNDSKHEQIYLGPLVKVGDGWRLTGLPTIGSDNQVAERGFLQPAMPQAAPGVASMNVPSDEMQKLMSELEQLDRQGEGADAAQQATITEKRADLLRRMAELSADADLRDQWYRQLADMISLAIQAGNYPQGLGQLDDLQKKLVDSGVGNDLIAHTKFQRMWAEYVLSQQSPNADAAKVQEKWLSDLQDFIDSYPKSGDAAEALLQLGMYHEFVGKSGEAQKWYQQLVGDFAQSQQANKAAGALRRLTSVGKNIRLQGPAMQGGAVDLNSPHYRGKLVLVQYWATWCEPCKQDMILLKDFYAKNANRGFEIIGVCLGDDPNAAKQFLTENRIPWKQIYEEGGLDGRLANEMGVMTLPLMLLVDQRGGVVSDNIHVAELDAELKRLVK